MSGSISSMTQSSYRTCLSSSSSSSTPVSSPGTPPSHHQFHHLNNSVSSPNSSSSANNPTTPPTPPTTKTITLSDEHDPPSESSSVNSIELETINFAASDTAASCANHHDDSDTGMESMSSAETPSNTKSNGVSVSCSFCTEEGSCMISNDNEGYFQTVSF